MNLKEEAIKMVAQARKAGATAIKVEFEGRVGRYYANGYGTKISCETAHERILTYLKDYGLAEEEGDIPRGMAKPMKWKYPIMYSRVYGDCETEWTVTLSLDKAENVLHLLTFIDAFNHLAKSLRKKEIGTDGAGMHMAFLFNKECKYPVREVYGYRKFGNFKKSVTPLLPALFFISANMEKDGKVYTRSAGPRQATISGGKFSAIHYGGGALEFRVFDPCYKKPNQILTNFIVMSKCLRYWTDQDKVNNKKLYDSYPAISFGRNNTSDIETLYYSKEHIDLLNKGLVKVKPASVSVKELKVERKFNRTKRHVKKWDGNSYSYGSMVLK